MCHMTCLGAPCQGVCGLCKVGVSSGHTEAVIGRSGLFAEEAQSLLQHHHQGHSPSNDGSLTANMGMCGGLGPRSGAEDAYAPYMLIGLKSLEAGYVEWDAESNKCHQGRSESA